MKLLLKLVEKERITAKSNFSEIERLIMMAKRDLSAGNKESALESLSKASKAAAMQYTAMSRLDAAQEEPESPEDKIKEKGRALIERLEADEKAKKIHLGLWVRSAMAEFVEACGL